VVGLEQLSEFDFSTHVAFRKRCVLRRDRETFETDVCASEVDGLAPLLFLVIRDGVLVHRQG